MTNFILQNNCYVIVDRFKGNAAYRYTLVILKEKSKEIYRIVNLTRGHICPCQFQKLKDVKDDLLKYQNQKFIKILEVRY